MRSLLCQSKIQNLGLMALRHKNIGRLDVAMNNALGVSGIKRIRNLNSQVEQLVRFQGLAMDSVLQSLPLQQLHCDEVTSLILGNFVNGADIGMIECRSSARFTLETVECAGIVFRFGWQELERNPAS